MEISKKLEIIIKEYKDRNAQLWNIDTNFYNQYSRFSQNLKNNFNINNFNYTYLKIEHSPIEDNKFLVSIDSIDLTPKKSEGHWSRSAVLQFLQVGMGLGFLIFNEKQKFIDKQIQITSKMANLLSNNFNWADILMKLLKISTISNVKFVNRLGYSLFMFILMNENVDLLNSIFEHEIKWIQQNRQDNELNKKTSTNKNLSEIILFKNKLSRDYKNAYEDIIKKYSLEKIIDNMYSFIFEEQSNYHIDEFNNIDYNLENINISYENIITKTKEMREFENKVELIRNNLRKNIINSRVNNVKRYSDLILDKEPMIKYTEAAHIFEVNSIKKEGIKIINENPKKTINSQLNELLKMVVDANNGLLLPLEIHKAFDNEVFYLDLNGNVIYSNDNKEEIEYLGIANSRIRPDIFNDEMAKYLKRRKYF